MALTLSMRGKQGFGLIVPCGIADRPVCSLRQILGPDCPSLVQVAFPLPSLLARFHGLRCRVQS